ncbi:putative ABC transport system substrate-binding protein [Rhodobium orientis]|uniref:ABC transporter permease n=1 Tax=Rhodobium orientis TaxID=34017 RepID=A0A327JNZ2_9HYPH|nr:ABC transporter substrate-binding protein [Rhodobium orientis]MBB4301733.1 putative ABC transport system substrate-binding protein [Rhodobium orientis]MBK5950536.1 ABC transporter permease [Rhodobium orientis]RAI28180.1 ABC transporter permease [Rhodobium orientis]
MRKLLLALAAASAIASPALAADTVTVAVTAIVEHPALDACRDGVKDALAEAGYKDGENLTFVYESAQGNPATAAQIARQFIGEAPDVIVPISTPSAQAVVAGTRDIPVVFTAVTDPVGAKLISNTEKPGGNVTGLSDFSPLDDHLALIREISPDAKTIGIVYNSGEANSVALLEGMRSRVEAAGMELVESVATKSAEVQGATRALIGKADVIYIPTDNTIVSALEAAVKVAEENDIPLYSGDTDSVSRGALAAVGFNYHDIGVQTGQIVARVLKGEKPGDIAVKVAAGTNLIVNPGAAERMGVTIPKAVIDRANTVVE